ncbi:hypothetical protein GH714_027260 [Hevea brasiliensis]|uniref:CRAL-TRIO domain-containing protein n=1 Tax=Hevea brasiliensis TaxID=3981 RepID=A0A6A6KXN0_HEVBR|nr:hypothetical protein GH714_027260 [Hevea brasiliensis]
MEEEIEKGCHEYSEDDEAKAFEEEEMIFSLLNVHENNNSIHQVDHLDSKNIIREDEIFVASLQMKLRKKKALLEFRCMVEDAILGNYILENPKVNLSKKEMNKMIEQLGEITLWGVPLLPSKGHEGTDTVLLKFLKAKDFKVQEAFNMLRKTLKWRKDYKTDAILEEDLLLDLDLDKVLYVNSVDKQGNPLYYNMYGAFKDKEFYKRVLGTEEDREKFLRWRIQFMEKIIKKLTFKAGEAGSVLQITDFKNSPGPEMKELRAVSKKAFFLLQANYPEIIHANILINVPFWYYTSLLVSSKLVNHRTKRNFIFVRPSKVTQTLLKYITPENLPIEYGGLKRDNDGEFLPEDSASEVIVKGNSSRSIKIPVSEAGVTIVWEFTVVGWDVTCREEFIPEDEGSYKILLRKSKERKMGECVRNSFYINEPGKIMITIDNATLKKRRVYYRSKIKPFVPNYIINNIK